MFAANGGSVSELCLQQQQPRQQPQHQHQHQHHVVAVVTRWVSLNATMHPVRFLSALMGAQGLGLRCSVHWSGCTTTTRCTSPTFHPH